MGGAPANFIEDVFQTWLYTGNGSTQTITNGIDLATKGGLVWLKPRDQATSNMLFDTSRGTGKIIYSDATAAQATDNNSLTAFNSNGFSLGTSGQGNGSPYNYVSWTFRKQPKFFDVVTYTGDDNFSGRQIAHNLGSVPGCILIKKTSGAKDWEVWHRSLTDGAYVQLNSTAAQTGAGGFDYFGASATQTSTYFTLGDLNDDGVNRAGATYVAYLFAHNAGGFGLSGTDNVISCGSSVGGGSAGDVTVNLGYEPQWVLLKNITTTNAALGPWILIDNMRGYFAPATGENYLRANASNAEATGGFWTSHPTATGFTHYANAGETYIYIAIRRGPMKVPTTGTSVFTPVSTSGNVTSITSGFPVDFALGKEIKNSTSYGNYAIDRLRGGAVLLETNTVGAEYTSQTFKFDSNTQFLQSGGGLFYGPSIYWLMRRAPGFFDEVCYMGTGSATTFSHNLGVAPELWIIKKRSDVGSWAVGSTSIASSEWLVLQATDAKASNTAAWNSTYPSSTVFTVGNSGNTNGSGATYVAYLFASAPGVSKVGSYTGNGSNQTINCGFTGGARFVMIKRTDNTGDWYVWDTARGIVSGNDPHLSLNTTAAEVTTDDSVDTDSTGFVVNQLSATNINVTSATYIFLAIA